MGHSKKPEIFRLAQENYGQPIMNVASESDSKPINREIIIHAIDQAEKEDGCDGRFIIRCG